MARSEGLGSVESLQLRSGEGLMVQEMKWLWVKNTGYPKKPIGKRKKNRPKRVVPRGFLFDPLPNVEMCFLFAWGFLVSDFFLGKF